MRPEIPGALSWAAVKRVFLTSFLVMLVYGRSSVFGSRLMVGGFARVGGSGKRLSLSVSHFSLWLTACGRPVPLLRGGEVYVGQAKGLPCGTHHTLVAYQGWSQTQPVE